MADKKTHKTKKRISVRKSFHKVMGGDFLKNKSTAKMLPLLFFLSVLAVIYIANSYYAQKTNKKIFQTQKELKEHRFEYISVRSELMQQTRPSDIARGLTSKGVKESNVPPYKIQIK